MSSLSLQLATGIDKNVSKRTCQHILQILGMSTADAIKSVRLAQPKLVGLQL
jgi:hypothetical protein